MDHSTLAERAARISEITWILSAELAQLGVLEPSFEKGLPAPLHNNAPDSVAATARQNLLQNLDEYRALLTKPTLLLTPELVGTPWKFYPRTSSDISTPSAIL